jgi:NIMA (never in mitosis gene a)-related kinase
MPREKRRHSDVHETRSSRWETKIEKGRNGGGLNGGINVVADRRTGKAYIEKLIPANLVSGGYAKKEIEVMKQLRGHDFIVQIVDYYLNHAKKEASIVMEFCTMGSLEKLIERHRKANMRPIGEHYIWKWFMQITCALCYCHYGPSPKDPAEMAKWNPIFHRGRLFHNAFCTDIDY